MVTKQGLQGPAGKDGYVLAKIQMVTKLLGRCNVLSRSYVLAKIQMVTKR